MKYRSVIYVQFQDGSKSKGTRVRLNIKEGLFSGGFTSNFYTDRDGRVIIEHVSKGEAEIYVSGRKVGTFKVPAETVVFI